MRRNKFGVAPKPQRTWVGKFRGRKQTIVFDSKGEMNHFCDLLIMLKAGKISELQLQEKFPLVDPSKDEKSVSYRADFTFFDNETHKWTVQDYKGHETQTYKLKRKLFKARYPEIEFVEVRG